VPPRHRPEFALPKPPNGQKAHALRATAVSWRVPAPGRRGGGRAGGASDCHSTTRKQFFAKFFYGNKKFYNPPCRRPALGVCLRAMTFYSLPFAPERPEATEARLEAIYEAAKYGLRGDSLAMAAGLTPAQYRRLAEFDPLVELAELKGRSDGEMNAAKTLYNAAAGGDAKAALDILKHQHGWVAKQQIDVSIDQQISVISALERAQTRVIEGLYTELTPLEDNRTNAAANLLRSGRDGVDDATVVAVDQE